MVYPLLLFFQAVPGFIGVVGLATSGGWQRNCSPGADRQSIQGSRYLKPPAAPLMASDGKHGCSGSISQWMGPEC